MDEIVVDGVYSFAILDMRVLQVPPQFRARRVRALSFPEP